MSPVGTVECRPNSSLPHVFDAVSFEYTNTQITPPLDEWSRALQVCAFDNSRITDLRRSARTRLVDRAQQFTLRLAGIADDAGMAPMDSGILTGDPASQPIVMTGHQPVVFHSGLTFKYEITEQVAADASAICVGVVIDTDLGDAGQFSYPESNPDSDAPKLAIETLAKSNNLYLNGRLRSAAEIGETGNKVENHLQRLGRNFASERFSAAIQDFTELASTKVSAMEANLIVRWQRGIGGRMLEIPLSAVASFPESLMLTADILKQPARFAAAYNSALEVFRGEHNIRNAANPFPNLKIDKDSCELPFWLISHNRGRRYVLEAQVDGNVTRLIANGKTVDTFTGNITAESLEPMLVQNIQIVPRGAMITAFLRLLFADLFVHGTGGGRYDQFTDEFMRTWWNVEPSPFTVASASRYLFPELRAELERLEGISSSLRELQFNPQRHFGSGVFGDQLENELRRLSKEKDDAVSRMKRSHAAGDSAKEIGKQIQQITNRMKDVVTTEFEPQLETLTSMTAEQRDAVNCRTYPWFMFI